MPVDQRDLVQPEDRQVVNAAAADLNVEAEGLKQKAEKVIMPVVEGVKEAGQSIANKADEISRRDFMKLAKWAAGVAGAAGLVFYLYVKRYGIFSAIEAFANKFEVVEEKPIDPRIAGAFGEAYLEEAKIQGAGQFSLYLLGNQDKAFDMTNIPKLNQKDNTVWYITSQYGITWPFVTPERDMDKLNPAEFQVADRQMFIDKISGDLGLNEQQKIDLGRNYENLSKDPSAVLNWLKQLQTQRVEKITQQVIDFYIDPVGFVTGISQ